MPEESLAHPLLDDLCHTGRPQGRGVASPAIVDMVPMEETPMRHRILILIALALLLAVPTVEGISQAQGGQANVRAVHAIPGGPPVNVTVNDNEAFSGVNYKDVTDYTAADAGTATVQVVPADNPESPLLDIQTDLEASKDYSIVAAGTPEQPEPLVLEDDNSPVPQGQARVRFVHVAPNAPPVDVAPQGGSPLFSNIAYLGVGGYELLDAGTVTLEVREAGTENVLLTVPNVNLESCAVHTIWAMGLPEGDPPLEAVTSTDAPPRCVVTAVAGTPGAGAAAPAATKAVTRVRPVQPTGPAATRSPSPARTVTGTRTATQTPTATATNTATRTPTKTGTPTRTRTPTRTFTPTFRAPKIAEDTPAATQPASPGAQATQPPTQVTVPAQATQPPMQTTSPGLQATQPPTQVTVPTQAPGGGEEQGQ